MALISLGSVGAAPGVTTLSVVAAGCWPRPVVLVEADPSGGVLAVRYRLGRTPGLSGLAATVRQGAPPEAIWSYAQMLPGDLPVVVSPESGPVATAILEDAAHALADWCASQDQVDVIVDCGRIAVRDVTWPLWAAADEMLLLARPRADELYPLAHRSRALASHVRSLGTVLVGERPYRPEEVAEQLRLPVRGVIADDPRAARVLATGGSGRTLRRSPLVRSARSLVDALCLQLGIPVVSADEERLLGSRGAGEAGGRRRPRWKAIGSGRTAPAPEGQVEPTPTRPGPPADKPQPAGTGPAAAGRRLGGASGPGQPSPVQPSPVEPAASPPPPSPAPGWATTGTAGTDAPAASQAPTDQPARPAPAASSPATPEQGTTSGPSREEPETDDRPAGDNPSGAIPMPPAGAPPEPTGSASPPAASGSDRGEGRSASASPPPPPGSTMRAVVGKLTGGGFPAPPSPPEDGAPISQPPPPPPPPPGFRRAEPPPTDDATGSAKPGTVPDPSPGGDGDGLEGFIKAADALENLAASAKMPTEPTVDDEPEPTPVGAPGVPDNGERSGDSMAAPEAVSMAAAPDESIDMLERTARVLADGAHPLPETGEVPAVGRPPLERRTTGQVPAITSEKATGDLTATEKMSNNGGRGDGDGTQRDDHRQGDEDDKITQSANPGPDRDAHLEPTPAVPAAAAGGAVSGRRTARPDPGAASAAESPAGRDAGNPDDDSTPDDAPTQHGDSITTGGRWLS